MSADKKNSDSEKREMDWLKVLFVIHLNVLSFIGIILAYHEAYISTILFSLFLALLGILGATAGSHRLWAHRSYTASTRLRIFLMLCQTLSGQGSIFDWVLQHRMHHKYFETNLDPFNPSKGWFYAHVLSITLKKSPAMEEKEHEIDMSDLEEDKIVMFQKRYYWILYGIVFFLLPFNAPAEYWGEKLVTSLFVAVFLRYGIVLHLCWLIHSATRIWGLQPGEKFPADTNLVFILTKSYWLPYHYLTPWDYQTSEYGKYGTDCVSKFIRVCAALEDATDLRTVDSSDVRNALSMSVNTKRSIQECILEVEKAKKVDAEHYLQAAKYY